MRKWEYCSIIWISTFAVEERAQELLESGALLAHPSGSKLAQVGYLRFATPGRKIEQVRDLHHAIAELGRDGWELTSHTGISTPALYDQFWFKRPIPAT